MKSRLVRLPNGWDAWVDPQEVVALDMPQDHARGSRWRVRLILRTGFSIRGPLKDEVLARQDLEDVALILQEATR